MNEYIIEKRTIEIQLYNLLISLQATMPTLGLILEFVELLSKGAGADVVLMNTICKKLITMPFKYAPKGNEYRYITCCSNKFTCAEVCIQLGCSRGTYYNIRKSTADANNTKLTFEVEWYEDVEKVLNYFSSLHLGMMKGKISYGY